MEQLDRLQRLNADVDLRLLPMWEDFDQIEDEETRHLVTLFCRAAYARGYKDAWSEERPASFFTDNGYSVPVRQT